MYIYFNWPNIKTDDEKKDLINHLKITCTRHVVAGGKRMSFVEDICIYALENHDGKIDEGWNFAELVQSYGKALTDTNTIIGKYHDEMNSPMRVCKAAEYLGISEGYVRQLARCEIGGLEGEKYKGAWIFKNLVSMNDWLLKTGRVKIN